MVPGFLSAETTFRRLEIFFRRGLARRLLHLHPEVDEEFVDVELAEKLADGLGAHLARKASPPCSS